ncbi:MAG TPA: hypothetical protein DCM68_04420 [Verrucomicrobia bacterium]|nr:hypothetical protein [Verrucomicrobiota bacterium]
MVEMFYETLLAEKYTFGQAASRCLVEFQREVQAGGRDALVALSVILSRLTRNDPAALKRFKPELKQLQELAKKTILRRGLSADEKERLQEDLRFVIEKAGG